MRARGRRGARGFRGPARLRREGRRLIEDRSRFGERAEPRGPPGGRRSGPRRPSGATTTAPPRVTPPPGGDGRDRRLGERFFLGRCERRETGRKIGPSFSGDVLGRREATREVRGVRVRCGGRAESVEGRGDGQERSNLLSACANLLILGGSGSVLPGEASGGLSGDRDPSAPGSPRSRRRSTLGYGAPRPRLGLDAEQGRSPPRPI